MSERPFGDGLRGDRRAVSVSVGYVLNLAIAALLLGGLFVAGGSFVQGEREAAVEGELTVVGERVSADLMTVDRLAAGAESPGTATVELNADLPPRVSGSGYRLTIESADGDGTILLEDERSGISVEIPFRVRTDIAETTVAGGDLTIRWDADAEQVVVES